MVPSKTKVNTNTMSANEYFASLSSPRSPRSSFDRSCELLTTMSAGSLYPIYWDEVLPGDTWDIESALFARITTLLKPIMDNLWIDLHWFFTPNRIIHTDWVTLMGEQPDPSNPVTVTVPQVVFDNSVGTLSSAFSIAGYLGIPYGRDKISVSAYPFRAFLKTFDDWYRDENHQAEKLPVSARGNANVTYIDTIGSQFEMLWRYKVKDYFTSALPWAQKGTAPTLSIGTFAPVLGIGKNNQTFAAGAVGPVYESDGTTASYASSAIVDNTNANNRFYVEQDGTSGYPNIRADLSQAGGFTLNAFREFATLQQYLELDARAGTRYSESLHAQFGVQPEDSRLQRVEFLGSDRIELSVTPIPQTSVSGTTPQGNLAGMGIFGSKSNRIIKSFKEDGIIMCVASVRSQPRYQQGLARKFSRVSRFDYYRPVFAHLGEQPILNQELYCQDGDTPGNPNIGVFGYQEAWAEYRYSQSTVTGEMNSDYSTPLDNWHLAQDYGALPTLNNAFLKENPPMDRVIAVTTQDQIQLNGAFKLKVSRAMPMRSTPGLTRL